MVIIPATTTDLPEIYWLFEQAIAYQKENNFIGWQTYDKDYLAADVERGLLFKLINEAGIAGIFCVCYTDELIWREREKHDAVYLHRIVVHPAHRGVRLFEDILHWARQHAKDQGRNFVRMDTWASNKKLIGYYLRYG
ncbi:MAG: GNAT family N-acetyltransferase, partial [Pedobacter sp.]